VAGKSKH
jgi:hypothetical protein